MEEKTIEQKWNNIQYKSVYPWQVWDLIKSGHVVYVLNRFFKSVLIANGIPAGTLSAMIEAADKRENEYDFWYEEVGEEHETV